MNYDPDSNKDFRSTAEFAEKFTRKESPKASRILDLLIDKPKRDYLNLSFTYLRWADDIVDNSAIPLDRKKEFIVNQKNLLTSFITGKNPGQLKEHKLKIEEACIFYFLKYSESTGNYILIDEVKNMMEALSMDVYRQDYSGIFSNQELERYIDLMSKSFFNILCIFFDQEFEYRPEYYLGPKFTTTALMIRDLEEDIDAGYINVGTEDIKKYNIDLNNIKNDKNFSLWLADRIKYILDILYAESKQLNSLPLKFKIFTFYSLVYRLPSVIRAKVYNYSLRNLSRRTALKELKTRCNSFRISAEIFLNIFFTKNLNNHQSENPAIKAPNLSLKNAFKSSACFIRRRSAKLWLQAVIYISGRHRRYFYMSYAYLRWADDYVDNPLNDKIDKIRFIERQLKLADSLLDGNSIQNSFNCRQESYLYYLAKYALENKIPYLISEIKRSLQSIRMDAVRLLNGGIFSNSELDLYAELSSKPLFNIIYYFLLPAAKKIDEDNSIGRFLEEITMLRDFFEDLELGYVNVEKEDIEKYNLDINNLRNDKKLAEWMSDKYPGMLNLLYKEVSVLKLMPGKLKLFWTGPYLVVLKLLIRIKVYNYRVGLKLERSIIKELNVFFQYFILSIRVVRNIFWR